MLSLISTSKELILPGIVGLSLGLSPALPVRADEPGEVEILKAELAGDQAYVVEWLAQPEPEEGVSPMHTDPEIRAVAERMPKAQARLRELEKEPAPTEVNEAP